MDTVPDGVETEGGHCLTVAQLKALVRDWPETNRDGEPTEVWIETGWCLSSPVTSARPLNLRDQHGGGTTADIILASALYDEPPAKGGG